MSIKCSKGPLDVALFQVKGDLEETQQMINETGKGIGLWSLVFGLYHRPCPPAILQQPPWTERWCDLADTMSVYLSTSIYSGPQGSGKMYRVLL